MAKRILAINIEDTVVRYLYLERTNGHCTVRKAGEVQWTLDITTGKFSEILFQIMKSQGISPQEVSVSVAVKDTVVHQVVLPKMSGHELEEVVAGEIEKIPHFNQQKFDYIFKNYPAADSKNRIIFAAIKRDLLHYLFYEIQKTEIPIRHLDISPLNLKELQRLTNGKFDQFEAMLVIHDQYGYLTIYEGQKYKLLYRLSFGLSQLAGADPTTQEKTIATWAAEIKRVLKSFVLDKKIGQVNVLTLVWDQQKFPGLDKRLEDHLTVSINAFVVNAISKIKFWPNVNSNPIHALALVPVACTINRVKPDFPLEHFFRNYQLEKYVLKMASRSAIILACLGLLFGFFSFSLIDKKQQYIREAAEIVVEASQAKAQAADLYRRYDEYVQVKENLLNQASYLQQLNRISWAQVLSVVASELPEDLALTSFKFRESGAAEIQGQAYKMESIAELIRRTEVSRILEKGNFDFLKEKNVDNQKLLNFGIFAKLKAGKEESLNDTPQN